MSENKKEDSAHALLKAAENEFKKNGYKKTSVNRISEEAGVSIGTLYACFKNKRQLFDEIQRPDLINFNPDDTAQKNAVSKVALKIFAEKGYAATTMDYVAASCGFSKAVLYRYFKNKEELFSSIFENEVFYKEIGMMHLKAPDSDLHDFLKCAGVQFLKAFDDPSRLNMLRVLLSNPQSLPHAGKIMYKNTVAKITDFIADCLSSYEGLKDMKKDKLKMAGRSYLGMMYSYILTDRILNPSERQLDIDKITDFAADIFEKGLLSSAK